MTSCRDAVDVNYQRMAITGEELSGVSLRLEDPSSEKRSSISHYFKANVTVPRPIIYYCELTLIP